MISAPAFPAHWGAGAAHLIADTASSLIWKLGTTARDTRIVKQLKPKGHGELRGMHFLAWRDGLGAVRLIDQQPPFFLLEYAGAYTLKDHLDAGHDHECISITSAVIHALHQPSALTPPAELHSTESYFRSLFDRDKDEADYGDAIRLAAALFMRPAARIPLHGDLHHENIVLGPRGWLAIDPHGLIGDPALDAANFFYNPLERDDLCLDMARARRIAEGFAAGIGRSPAEILDYAHIYGCLSAAWYGEDADSAQERRTLSVAAALRRLRLSLYS